jgi:hypothetical protein
VFHVKPFVTRAAVVRDLAPSSAPVLQWWEVITVNGEEHRCRIVSTTKS